MANNKTHLEELLAATTEKYQSKDFLINKEYKELEMVPPAPGKAGRQHDTMVKKKLCKRAVENEDKNRYCNLYPFDTNLFHYYNEKSYINASWVDFDDGLKYLVTMAPLHPSSQNNQDTCPDFWEMCWQAGARIIVMLCTVSPGFSGCSQYFPLCPGSSATHGDLLIKHENTETFNEYVERNLVISKAGESRKVSHLQYKAWPIYSVPEQLASISHFVTLVHRRAAEVNKDSFDGSCMPYLVVHCSGGIGRSGTFLTCFVMYSRLRALIDNSNSRSGSGEDNIQAVSLKDLVLTMRTQRHPWMVEGLHQYKLAYEIVIELVKDLIKNA